MHNLSSLYGTNYVRCNTWGQWIPVTLAGQAWDRGCKVLYGYGGLAVFMWRMNVGVH